jgi:ribosomal protein S12 methylthiotransferase accessory factor
VFDAREVTNFEIHAAYYTFHPDRWVSLPIWGGPHTDPPADAPVVGPPGLELCSFVASLTARGVDTYYRELTTVDVAQVGLRVIRALAPKLTPIHADHRWPYLGGSAGDLAFRYPWAKPKASFPIDAPHPLG